MLSNILTANLASFFLLLMEDHEKWKKDEEKITWKRDEVTAFFYSSNDVGCTQTGCEFRPGPSMETAFLKIVEPLLSFCPKQ